MAIEYVNLSFYLGLLMISFVTILYSNYNMNDTEKDLFTSTIWWKRWK